MPTALKRGDLMSDFLNRIAGAPITWGVDGTPGWGHLMDANRVLSEMQEVGLKATELGPDGYLPEDPGELAVMLDKYGLDLVGGFVPVVLHIPDRVEDSLDYFARASKTLSGCGSSVVVLAAGSGLVGYDQSIDMTEEEWKVFLENMQKVVDIAEGDGLVTAFHQHWGMAIEQPKHVLRLLNDSNVDFCLDTGHLFLGGADPTEIARAAVGRVSHVHLKDVDSAMAEQVRAHTLPFRQANIDGIFVPVGDGAIDFQGFIETLEDAGYEGWYVLEQDCVLEEDPARGEGPILDAKKSIDFLRSLDIS
jgi:inosose dehydratase